MKTLNWNRGGAKKLDPQLVRERAQKAWERIDFCRLCPQVCGSMRLDNEIGDCQTGYQALVSSVMPHYGEERCLSGTRGSGTIFFAGCNLDCIYCQNYDLSHLVDGKAATPYYLASAMIFLQDLGCHNLNLVTPTHVIPQILEALALAVEEGFCLPIVYNSSGYDSVRTLQLLEGIIDIYMPDFKYWDSQTGQRFSGVNDYPDIAREAIREMHRQVGDLILDEHGLASRGLLVRHLVLPNGLAGTAPIMRFLAEEISPNTYINIMGQYHPCWYASLMECIRRPLRIDEWNEARNMARAAGLIRFADQGFQ